MKLAAAAVAAEEEEEKESLAVVFAAPLHHHLCSSFPVVVLGYPFLEILLTYSYLQLYLARTIKK